MFCGQRNLKQGGETKGEESLHVVDSGGIETANCNASCGDRGGAVFHSRCCPNAHRYFPRSELSGDLCRAALWRNEPGSNGRLSRLLLRVSLSLHQRDRECRG